MSVRARPQASVHRLGDIEVLIDGDVAALAVHAIGEFGTDFNFRFRDLSWRSTVPWER